MSQVQSVLGFDFGTKSIGIAIGNALTCAATPIPAIKARDGIPNWETVEAVLAKWQPDKIIVGLPLNMDGSEQELTRLARKFGQRLHGRFLYPVEYQDERLTTADAKARLFEQGGYKALAKGAIDSVSAALIVESWLESQYD